jgi:hypothetical protein
MNKQELLRTLSIGLILIRGLVSVYRAMMHNSLTIFGKIVIIRWSQRQGNENDSLCPDLSPRQSTSRRQVSQVNTHVS